MPKLVSKMSDFGVIVCEHSENYVLKESYGDFKIEKTKRYGIVYITYYRRTGE